jgi:hypothetical protein
MVRVASFNVKNLSQKCLDETSQKSRNLKEIAKLVRDCDIVVLQEVLDREVVASISQTMNSAPLLKQFGHNWRGVWVNTQANSVYFPYEVDTRHEGYAFLWDTRKVEPVKDVNGNDILPKTYSHYKAGSESNKMLRYPGYGRFILRNRIRPIEIRVITTHIAFNKPTTKEDFEIPDKKEIDNRRREFDILSGWIYKNIDDYHKEPVKNAVYTIIVGDYNLSLRQIGIDVKIDQTVTCYDRYGNRTYAVTNYDDAFGVNVMKTVQSEPTTINRDCTDYANNYDHCTYNYKIDQAIRNCYRKPVLNGKTPEEIKEYHDTVSDHVPIVVDIHC